MIEIPSAISVTLIFFSNKNHGCLPGVNDAIVAIAAVAGLFAVIWPYAKNTIVNKWNATANSVNNLQTR